MQDDNPNDSGLKELEPVGNDEMVDVQSGLIYSLALEEENDSQSGFYSVVESDCEQITQAGSKE